MTNDENVNKNVINGAIYYDLITQEITNLASSLKKPELQFNGDNVHVVYEPFVFNDKELKTINEKVSSAQVSSLKFGVTSDLSTLLKEPPKDNEFCGYILLVPNHSPQFATVFNNEFSNYINTEVITFFNNTLLELVAIYNNHIGFAHKVSGVLNYDLNTVNFNKLISAIKDISSSYDFISIYKCGLFFKETLKELKNSMSYFTQYKTVEDVANWFNKQVPLTSTDKKMVLDKDFRFYENNKDRLVHLVPIVENNTNTVNRNENNNQSNVDFTFATQHAVLFDYKELQQVRGAQEKVDSPELCETKKYDNAELDEILFKKCFSYLKQSAKIACQNLNDEQIKKKIFTELESGTSLLDLVNQCEQDILSSDATHTFFTKIDSKNEVLSFASSSEDKSDEVKSNTETDSENEGKEKGGSENEGLPFASSNEDTIDEVKDTKINSKNEGKEKGGLANQGLSLAGSNEVKIDEVNEIKKYDNSKPEKSPQRSSEITSHKLTDEKILTKPESGPFSLQNVTNEDKKSNANDSKKGGSKNEVLSLNGSDNNESNEVKNAKIDSKNEGKEKGGLANQGLSLAGSNDVKIDESKSDEEFDFASMVLESEQTESKEDKDAKINSENQSIDLDNAGAQSRFIKINNDSVERLENNNPSNNFTKPTTESQKYFTIPKQKEGEYIALYRDMKKVFNPNADFRVSGPIVRQFINRHNLSTLEEFKDFVDCLKLYHKLYPDITLDDAVSDILQDARNFHFKHPLKACKEEYKILLESPIESPNLNSKPAPENKTENKTDFTSQNKNLNETFSMSNIPTIDESNPIFRKCIDKAKIIYKTSNRYVARNKVIVDLGQQNGDLEKLNNEYDEQLNQITNNITIKTIEKLPNDKYSANNSDHFAACMQYSDNNPRKEQRKQNSFVAAGRVMTQKDGVADALKQYTFEDVQKGTFEDVQKANSGLTERVELIRPKNSMGEYLKYSFLKEEPVKKRLNNGNLPAAGMGFSPTYGVADAFNYIHKGQEQENNFNKKPQSWVPVEQYRPQTGVGGCLKYNFAKDQKQENLNNGNLPAAGMRFSPKYEVADAFKQYTFEEVKKGNYGPTERVKLIRRTDHSIFEAAPFRGITTYRADY